MRRAVLHKLGVVGLLGWMRLGEKPARALYLMLTLAVTVMAWSVLAALASPFMRQDSRPLSYITVMNERQGGTFPLRHAARIAQMDGVASVEYMNLLPLICRPPATVATLNAWGGAAVVQQLRQQEIPAATIAAWRADPMGVLVGAQLAERCGWRPGTVVQPTNAYTSQPTEVHIVGVFNADSEFGEQIAFAHYDYANRLLPKHQQDQAIMIQVRSTDPGRLPELANRIESEFAASDPPVQATTSSDAEGAWGRFGNVQALMWLVMAAMLACALLVFVSTLAHLASERRASMAMLQALGFRRGLLFAAMAVELAAIVAASTLLGLATGKLVLILLSPKVAHVLGHLATPSWAYWWLLPGLLALTALSLALPACTIARVRPIDHQST